MKRKGFTLIELLAVIVILAVIALITVPLLIDIVEKAKIGALKDSAYGLIESADLYYAQNMGKLDGYTKIEIKDGEQTSEKTLSYKGKIEGNGIIIISKQGKVQLCLTKDNIYVKKEFDDTEITVEEMTSDVTCNIPNEEDGDFSMSIVGSSSNYYDKETIDLKLDELNNKLGDISKTVIYQKPFSSITQGTVYTMDIPAIDGYTIVSIDMYCSNGYIGVIPNHIEGTILYFKFDTNKTGETTFARARCLYIKDEYITNDGYVNVN